MEHDQDRDPIHDDTSDPAAANTLRHDATEEHVTGFDYRLAACRRVLRSGYGPHHLAHFTAGVRDFDMDVLDRLDPSRADTAAHTREGCLQAERKLSLLVGGLDRMLDEVRTGALIRTVLHTDRGACYCDSIVPLEHVVGVRLELSPAGPPVAMSLQPGVRATDIVLSELVTDLREQLSQGTQNPGGWSTRKPDDRVQQPAARSTDDGQSPPQVRGADDTPLARACLAALDVRDLHYVAHCRQGELVFAADQFGQRRLAPFFTQVSADTRRDFYDGFGEGFGVLASRLSRLCAPAIGGPLQRVVLDVQQGALCYYRLDVGEYLFGVTLDQARVSDADDKLAQLAVECQLISAAAQPELPQ